ncbi:MAG: hypothetical protein KAR62_06905, partial [Sphingomonadales bacterium]|nr:hypothetical protein [Sphingomonadales bacterium]
TKQRFADIISSYGAEQNRWPEADRANMLAFMDKNPSAQTMLDDALSLDSFLNKLHKPKAADDAFLERLSVMAPPKTQNSRQVSKQWGFGDIFKGLPTFNVYGFMPRAVGLASVCAIGITLGLSDVARHDNAARSVDASALIFGGLVVDKDMEEMD